MKPMTFDFQTRRSMVTARRGMVATSNPLATQAGLAILRQGGNAADAAVAAAAVLNVTESASTGIGGDMFALFFDAKTKQVTALNGSGRAPAALTVEFLRDQGFDEIPTLSPHAITVPGAVAGWEDLLKRHGSMPLGDGDRRRHPLRPRRLSGASGLRQCVAALGAVHQKRAPRQ